LSSTFESMKYKILSLDGGGSWALIQARVLKDMYDDIRGHELLRKFDMVIANSGGSLVVACLCNDMRLSDIISVFRDEKLRKQVFSRLTFWEKLNWRNIASLITRKLGPRYDTKRKLAGLRNILSGVDHLSVEKKIARPIVDTPIHLLPAIVGKDSLQLIIVGFDYFRERVSFFRSNTKSLTDRFGTGDYYSVSLGDAIHSSSNAPVNYFDRPAEITIEKLNADIPDKRNSWFWDGGVSGFNNPVLAGVVEAITNDQGQRKHEDYCILSIGTSIRSGAILTDALTSTDDSIRNAAQKNVGNAFATTSASSGFVKDINKLATSILSEPPDSATFIAYSFLDPTLNGHANLIRINPCLSPMKDKDSGLYIPPAVFQDNTTDHKDYRTLMGLDMDAVKDEEVELINLLCDRFIVTDGSPALPNQLIRGNISGNFLGQFTYKEAKEKWMNL
jgi:hypothetical protein